MGGRGVRDLVVAALVAAAAAWPCDLRAADQAGAAHVSAGIALPQQKGPTGTSGEVYATAPGGVSAGWTAGAGAFVTGALSIDVEMAVTGSMAAREPSRHNMTFNLERRVWSVGIGARFRKHIGNAASIEPIVGAVLAWDRGWSQTEYTRLTSTGERIEVGPREPQNLPVRPGLLAGADLRLGGRHLAIVPSFRLHWTGERELSEYPGGYPAWTITPGVLLRYDF
jgi:hypothetical protein